MTLSLIHIFGPFGRASGVDYDVRMFGDGAYADLAAFEPIVASDGDCYARCQVRCAEVTQAMDIIKELVGKIPHDGIEMCIRDSPEVVGSNPAPATKNLQLVGLAGELFCYSGTVFSVQFPASQT